MKAKKIRIRDIAKIRMGYQSRGKIENDPNGTYGLLQIRDFNEDRSAIDISNMVRFASSTIQEEQLLREDDVVLLAKGAKNFSFAPIGIPFPIVAAPYFFVIRTCSSVLPGYLTWFLNQNSTRQYFTLHTGSGVRMPVIRRSVLEQVEIPVPRMEIQRGIIELECLLRQQLSLFDELGQKKKNLIETACMKAATQ